VLAPKPEVGRGDKEIQVMNIVERTKLILLDIGASPILYLMIGLSVVSVAIMVERSLFFFRVRENLPRLASELGGALGRGDIAGALELVAYAKSAEAAIVSAGLARIAQGPAAVEEAMAGASAVQRMRLERRLGFLGTLGSNAPFVGLLGTVIGIVQAFDQLQIAGAGSGGGAMNGVMGAIAEALVATAIGLVVAIPAVAAFNAFQRRIKGILGNAEALRHIVLSYVKASPQGMSGPAGSRQGSQDSQVVRFDQLSASAH
jgi:biopolymer transport protein ExbB